MIKFISYFIIINVLYFSITLEPYVFQIEVILIIVISLYELSELFVRSGFKNQNVFYLATTVLLICSVFFYGFSTLKRESILFTFLILSIFDSFSQISGQLFGRIKILPRISPNKTLEGLVGGSVCALLSAILLKPLYPEPLLRILMVATGVVLFAFIGDISASYYKRIFKVKDFSNLIPGHGGFLDRFDSLIVAGAWHALMELVNLENVL